MIEVKNLTKDFKETKALDNVSLRFAAGKIHGLIGRNGSGKTVLLKILCGFMAPTSGEVLFDGKPALPGALRESMGIIIESPGFIGSKSGFVNLWYLASLRKRITKEQVRQAMETVGLDPASKKAVRKYSMGMRQRLGIAQAIMEDPAVILLDEPMNGLDNQGVKDIRKVQFSAGSRISDRKSPWSSSRSSERWEWRRSGFFQRRCPQSPAHWYCACVYDRPASSESAGSG